MHHITLSNPPARTKIEVDSFFDSNHISLIQRRYFGSTKEVTSIAATYPAKYALFNCAESSHGFSDFVEGKRSQLLGQELVVAHTTYSTSFKDMWSNYKIFNYCLKWIITILLSLHLSPQRERNIIELIAKKSNPNVATPEATPVVACEVSGHTRNQQRKAIRDQEHKLKKYNKINSPKRATCKKILEQLK